MRMAVTGGNGTLGQEVVRELRARGHEVRVLSRRSAEHPVDLTTGAGLDAALERVEVVVDATNAGPARKPAEVVLLEGTRRLLVAERRAGVAHHVGVSIVGVDRVPYPYYEIKLAQESVIRGGGVPWTIVRATQFHSEVDKYLAAAARVGVLPGAGFALQPVDVGEVAVVVADTAEAEPSQAITQFAGPHVRSVRELARSWRDATGRRALIVPVPLFGATARALRDGGLTNRGAWTGRRTFGDWLDERYAAAAPASTGVRLGGLA
jgi:uncharacterized protein YbjT (DUF2867 family)